MRLVFMGTPEFALPSLSALEEAGYDIVGLFTQPDRPKGRGGKLQAAPTKLWALERGIPVYTPTRIRRDGLEDLAALAPDICVTAAYGQILSQEILDIPRRGTINVHASLLPKYRGAAPANFAIICGETRTGVTTMLTDRGLDTGAMLLRREIGIDPKDTAGTLLEKLSHLGAGLLVETLEGLESGRVAPIAQDESQASYYPLLKKEDGRLDWTQCALDVNNRIRGVNPWPGAFTETPMGVMKIWEAEPIDGKGRAGEILAANSKEGLVIACGDGALRIITLQAPSGKRMDSRDYLRGKPLEVGGLWGGQDG